MNDLAEMREVSLIVMGFDGSVSVSKLVNSYRILNEFHDYWSNEYGWVEDYSYATVFSDTNRDLPIDGHWELETVEPSYLAALIGANDADDLQLFPMFNYYDGKAAKVFVNKNAPIGSKNMNATKAYEKEYELIHKHAPKTNVYGNMLIITGPADTIDAIGPE